MCEFIPKWIFCGQFIDEDLKKIYGIGEVLADRIVKYREYIHGFSLREQLSEVYGLKNEVVERVWEKFEIKTLPKIVKIDINTANKSDLIKLPYINYKDESLSYSQKSYRKKKLMIWSVCQSDVIVINIVSDLDCYVTRF